MNQLWAIQTKLIQEDATAAFCDAFRYLGLNWAAFPYPPFVGHVPDFQWDGPIVYYGSTALVKKVSETPKLMRGSALFFDPLRHRPDWYGPQYGEAYLNRGSRLTTIREFIGEAHNLKERFFVRPNSGLKIFAGKVFDWFVFRDFLEQSTGNSLLSLDTEIVVNDPKTILREFRNWIVDGEVVASVQYKVGSRMLASPDVPEAVRDFARSQSRICSPSAVFVLDVAETPDGYEVVEVNCFNSSGVYLTEQDLDIVAEVSLYLKRASWPYVPITP